MWSRNPSCGPGAWWDHNSSRDRVLSGVEMGNLIGEQGAQAGGGIVSVFRARSPCFAWMKQTSVEPQGSKVVQNHENTGWGQGAGG